MRGSSLLSVTIRQRVLDWLQTKDRVEIQSDQDFFNEQLKYFDLAYWTDKHSVYLCEKGESKDVQDEDVKVVACALLNGYADQTKEDIEVNFIATKMCYEGLGYASNLILQILNLAKKPCK